MIVLALLAITQPPPIIMVSPLKPYDLARYAFTCAVQSPQGSRWNTQVKVDSGRLILGRKSERPVRFTPASVTLRTGDGKGVAGTVQNPSVRNGAFYDPPLSVKGTIQHEGEILAIELIEMRDSNKMYLDIRSEKTVFGGWCSPSNSTEALTVKDPRR